MYKPPSPPSPTGGQEAAFKALLVLGSVGVLAAHLAWLFGNITALVSGGSWAGYQPTRALLTPGRLWPDADAAALTAGTRIVPAVVLLTLAVLAALWWTRRHGLPGGPTGAGLAGPRDLAPLLPRKVTAKAKSLRPSLKDTKHPPPHETGILLGTLAGTRREIRMGYEDVAVAIMAPRAGKTTSLAVPAILDAPGPVILTSNKAGNDAYTTTLDARTRVGRTWTMDPQQIAHADQHMWWNPLTTATTLEGAARLAGHFLTAAIDADKRDFWSQAAVNTLTSLFLAAALGQRPVTDVMGWLANPGDRAPLDLLRDHQFPAVAAQLQGTASGPPETRDGIYETARQIAAPLLHPDIAAWVTPQKGVDEFQPAEFVGSRDTLYLLSKDGGGSASALIAAAADAVMRAAVAQAERAGGRLDPPLIAILDEAANVCKISDLPDLYSHLGSRGVIPLTILQSYRQGQRVWGETGMDALWSAATIKVIGSGIDDPDFADKLSRLIGDHDVPTQSISDSGSASGKSVSVSMRQERILPPDAIRALAKGTALCLATGLRAALLTLRPWYTGPRADELSAASARASRDITTRALTKAAPDRDDYDTAA